MSAYCRRQLVTFLSKHVRVFALNIVKILCFNTLCKPDKFLFLVSMN